MRPSRLYYASMMIFWVCFLSLLALVVTYAPQGGVKLAGLTLFADTGLINAAIAAMSAMGLSATAQMVVFGFLGGFNIAAAGLLLFAMLFCVLGQEAEQRDARPLAEAAVACIAAASVLVVAVSFAGGQAGALMLMEIAALGGLLLTVVSLGHPAGETVARKQDDAAALDGVIADHVANHAAFSAQLASLSRREKHS